MAFSQQLIPLRNPQPSSNSHSVPAVDNDDHHQDVRKILLIEKLGDAHISFISYMMSD